MSLYLVFLTLSFSCVTGQWWTWPKSELKKMENKTETAQSHIRDLKEEGDKGHQSVQKDKRILQLRSDSVSSTCRSSSTPFKQTATPTVGPKILVRVTVKDSLISQSLMSWLANGNEGDSMLVVMQRLEQQEPSFNFTCITSSFGESIRSIVGITTHSVLRQYWQFLRYPDIIMSTSISNTYPFNNDHFVFNMTTW